MVVMWLMQCLISCLVGFESRRRWSITVVGRVNCGISLRIRTNQKAAHKNLKKSITTAVLVTNASHFLILPIHQGRRTRHGQGHTNISIRKQFFNKTDRKQVTAVKRKVLIHRLSIVRKQNYFCVTARSFANLVIRCWGIN